MKKLISIFIAAAALFSANAAQITYRGSRGYTLVERSNLRRYDNGRYTGLVSREVRSFISPTLYPSDSSKRMPAGWAKAQWYDGNFYVMEETMRSSKIAAIGIHEAIPSVFYIDSDGKMTMFEDNGYPSFRSFPSYTSQTLSPGESWKAKAERAVDPLNKGIFTRMPIWVLYTFSGEELYKDEKVYRIKALWQTNYGFSNFERDPRGDNTLLKATGGHKADIIVRKSTGEAILIIDNVDETFAYSDGTQVNFKGTITLFTEYPPAVDRNKLLFMLQRVASVKDEPLGSSGAKDTLAAAESSSGKGISPAGLDNGEFAAGSGEELVAKADLVSDSGDGSFPGANESGRNSGRSGAKAGVNTAKTGSTGQNGAAGSNIGGSSFVAGSSAGAEGASSLPSGSHTADIAKAGSFGSNGANGSFGAKGSSGTDRFSGSSDGRGSSTGANRPSSASSKIAASFGTAGTKTGASGSGSSDGIPPKNNMLVEETSAGIRLSVRDIKFKADSAEVLPSESERLDEIAKALKIAIDNQFLIEGHTASVGKPAGEQKLSMERAQAIAKELSRRGIPAEKFICKGLGGNRPVASNKTDAGRAQNRRVEITILES